MAGELRARSILERQLGQRVCLHDDGTSRGMYDLRVGPAGEPAVAIECVGAVDPVLTETWNIGPAKGPWFLGLRSDWRVVIRPAARVNNLRQRIEDVLVGCEAGGMQGFLPVDYKLRRERPDLYRALSEMGVHSLNRYREAGSGEVSLGLPAYGGPIDSAGEAVPEWISEFLRAPERSDVLRKLMESGAPECHVFVAVTPAGAPWPVESYLGSSPDRTPSAAPTLPEPAAAVWICYGDQGLVWDGQRWRLFLAKPTPDG